ncbi:hypothetical protein C8R43DRAFT_1131281 [Mycena crocata]|nr:hypothetical protein C8R43DRAFT_1131281 [Mycena crocata]
MLSLYDVATTDAELIECLSALLQLKRLLISDQQQRGPSDDWVPGVLVVTDTLLTALTLTPGTPSIVPRLSLFDCQSALRFDDNLYLEFLSSRVQGRSATNPLACELWWLPDQQRALHRELQMGIAGFCHQRQLTFVFSLTEYRK